LSRCVEHEVGALLQVAMGATIPAGTDQRGKRRPLTHERLVP
jgi:hypothetical protein